MIDDLPHPNGLSVAHYRARVAIAKRVADSGGTSADLANELEITRQAVCIWFGRNPQLRDIHQRLLSNVRRGSAMRGSEVRRLALLTQVARKEITLSEAARRIGISAAALSVWRKNNWTAVHDAIHGQMEEAA